MVVQEFEKIKSRSEFQSNLSKSRRKRRKICQKLFFELIDILPCFTLMDLVNTNKEMSGCCLLAKKSFISKQRWRWWNNHVSEEARLILNLDNTDYIFFATHFFILYFFLPQLQCFNFFFFSGNCSQSLYAKFDIISQFGVDNLFPDDSLIVVGIVFFIKTDFNLFFFANGFCGKLPPNLEKKYIGISFTLPPKIRILRDTTRMLMVDAYYEKHTVAISPKKA